MSECRPFREVTLKIGSFFRRRKAFESPIHPLEKFRCGLDMRQQFETIEFFTNFGFEVFGQNPAISSSKLVQTLAAISVYRLAISHTLGEDVSMPSERGSRFRHRCDPSLPGDDGGAWQWMQPRQYGSRSRLPC